MLGILSLFLLIPYLDGNLNSDTPPDGTTLVITGLCAWAGAQRLFTCISLDKVAKLADGSPMSSDRLDNCRFRPSGDCTFSRLDH
jgi:hypothetical protein